MKLQFKNVNMAACFYSVGSNAFRLSIEWSRIVPRRGYVDEEAVAHYHRIFEKIDECALAVLHRRNISVLARG